MNKPSEENRKADRIHGNGEVTPIQGLRHPDPAVRKHSAELLKVEGNAEALSALHEANKRETNLNCKVEILRAIVELEQRFLVEGTSEPLACRLG